MRERLDGLAPALLVDAIILASLAVLIVHALSLSADARRLPLLVMVLVVVLVAVHAVGAVLSAWSRNEPTGTVAANRSETRRYLIATVVGFIGCGVAMALVGYRLATPLFFVAFLGWLRVPLRILVPFAIVGSALIYGLFSSVLGLR